MELPSTKTSRPPECGDYERRCRGLEALVRASDPIDYDVLVREMCAGIHDGSLYPTPYTILWYYAATKGVEIGQESTTWVADHRMGYLASALRIQRGCSDRWPILVVTAFEELLNEKVPKVFLDPSASGSSSRALGGGSGRPRRKRAAR